MNFDDLPDDDTPPESDATRQPAADSSPPQLRFDDLPSFDAMPDHSGVDQSPMATFAEHAAARAPVGAAAGVAGLAGAEAGAAAGAMAAPFLGPLAPAAPIAGAVIGGLGAGAGVGWLASKPVDWVLDKLGLNDSLQTGAQQNPTSAFLGDLAGNTLPAFGAGAASLATRGIGAAIGGGLEAGSEYANEGTVDPGKVAMAAGANAAFPRARGWAGGAAGRVTGAFKGTGTGAIQSPVAEEGQPGRPDLKAMPVEGADKDEVTVANDITTTAPGIAAANPPAPEIPGAGNPVGAPMQARSAARPNDPSRDYRKGAAESAAGVSTAETTVLSTAPIHEDISAALADEQPAPIETGLAEQQTPPATAPQPVAQPQGQVQPEAGSTPAANPVPADLIARATQRAMRRPIMIAPMPSIANSGKMRNSPVVIDPAVPEEFHRPLAVHETVEQTLMAEGMSYEQAHPIATQAEKAAVERAGMDWNEYSEKMAGLAKHIEAQKVDPESYAGLDLHVDPEQAIGHHGDKGATPARVTAAVTSKGKANIEAVRKELQFPGLEAALAKFDALDPDKQAAAAERGMALRATPEPTEAPVKQNIVPGERVKPEIRARREKALAAWNRAYELHGPEAGPLDAGDKATVLARAREAVAAAKEANGGADPLKAYKPGTKPTAYNWLSAARAAATKPTPANIQAFVSAHALGGETGQNVEGEIATKRRPDVESAAIGAPAQSRPRYVFPSFKDPTQQESKVYGEQQGELRNWLNKLDDVDRRLVDNLHPDLKLNVRTTQDPKELLQNLQDDLAEAQTKRPGKIELVPAEDVQGKPKPIRNRADLDRFQPTEPGAPATAGRSLDKNSPEFKAAAAAALKDTMVPTLADRLEREQAAQRNPENLEPEAPATGGFKDVADKFQRMMKDESGAGKAIPVPEWLTRRVNDWFSPTASDPVKETVHELNKEFNINDGAVKNMEMRLAANFAAAPEKSENWWTALYHAMENGKALDAEQQPIYDTYVKPLIDWHDRLYRMHQRENPDLPQKFDGVSKKFVTRMTADALDPLDRNEPWKRTLSDWAGALEDRTWFALDDGNGKRLTFHLGKDADGALELHVLRRGSDQTVSGLPETFTGTPGEKLGLKVGTTKHVFTVDHVSTPEIERDVPGVKFTKNPIITYSNAIRGMQAALIRMKMLEQIKDNEIFRANSTTDKEVAREKGFALEPTILNDLATRGGAPLYMDKRLKWTLDDFAKPGISDSVLDPVRRAAGNFAKGLYFLSPPFHVINVADNWAHAMASDALKFRQYPKMAAEQLTAIRSVFTQDKLQWEMRAAGGKPMLPTQLLDGGVIQQMMQKAGLQVAKNPSFLDPIAKATGIPIPDILHNAMVMSNKIMWGGNDMFLTSLYLRNKRLGMDPGTAMAEAHKWIGSYRPESPTFGGSRVLQKVVNDPAISWFGPYHQDLWRSYGNIIKGLTSKDVTPQQRKDAVGALVMSGVLMFGVYPYMLDKGAKLLTGNDEAEFGRRGMSALQDAAYHLVKGDKTYTNLAANVWTPSIPANMFIHGIENKDWTGKDIVPAAPLYKPGELTKAAARATDWLAQQAIPPYATLSSEERQPEASFGSVVKKFGEAAVGIKDPSEASQKYNAQLEKHQSIEAKKRAKKPGGMLEQFINRFE